MICFLPSEYTLIPFVLFLTSVAVMPLWRPMAWQRYAPAWSLLCSLGAWGLFGLCTGFEKASLHFLHTLDQEIFPFLMILGCLFGLARHLVWRVQAQPTPWINGLVLFLGSVLAGCIGTTGASLLVTRTLLDLNQQRQYKAHTFLFAIFLVGNIGGLLSTLGDPPLLLGFLQGVPWFWPTKNLWGTYLFHAFPLLCIYGLLDTWFYQKEMRPFPWVPFRMTFEGWPFLLGFVGLGIIMVLPAFDVHLPCPFWLKILCMGCGYCGIQKQRESWEVMLEVSWILFGVMMTALPVLVFLEKANALALFLSPGGTLSLQRCFWITGLCSSMLDNAPTYLVMNKSIGALPWLGEHTGLKAVSSGAVLMGALTYLGNAPNLLIQSLVHRAGIAMPSFFRYCFWSASLLIPLFMLYGWWAFS